MVRESTRVLGRGNHLILGCDVYSTAGRIKHRVRAGLARASGVTLDSIADLAHPHQFVASDLEALVDGEGLEIVAILVRESGRACNPTAAHAPALTGKDDWFMEILRAADQSGASHLLRALTRPSSLRVLLR